MRGSQTFATLFAEAPAPELKPLPRNGRDAELVESRNILLLHRYYWHSTREIEQGAVRMSFDSVVTSLSAEFFISKRRITDIIEANTHIVMQIRKEHSTMRPTEIARKFSRTWHWLNW
ncbi:hypothetical protein LWM68_40855 [Niabella sp. W65]|nr:hypothetical protein [Niabella sp. W65]MCH7368523.1 hypothetical protein [Niabella sp. W65]ULT44115.1 hypothetical protein KRR40_12565 [Niabella sp. I65]